MSVQFAITNCILTTTSCNELELHGVKFRHFDNAIETVFRDKSFHVFC